MVWLGEKDTTKLWHCSRTIVHWRSRDVDNTLKGYKLNLQTAIGSRAPASLLNFYFKYTFCRKVSAGQSQGTV